MRTKLAMMNTAFGMMNQLVLAIVKIIVRKVMIVTIGVEFLGINGLFSNVLSMLALAESGFGVAVVYKLYRPLAEDDTESICKYLNFYSKIYGVIASVVFVVGLLLTPVLPYIIRETSLPIHELYKYYILFLIQNVASYFIAYKTSFLTACQRSYLTLIANTAVTLIFSGVQIAVLYLTGNYSLYLTTLILNTLTINLTVGVLADRYYPYLKTIKAYQLDEEEKKDIFKNCKALIYHKIGAYVLTGTDNIIISAFVSIVAVGIYSNYVIVLNLINTMLTKLFDAIASALGNIYAKESREKTYDMYNMSFFLAFEIHMFCAAMFMALVQPFVRLIFGEDCLLDMFTVVILTANLFFVGLRRHTTAIKNAVGLFYQDRYAAFLEALINLVVSIVLVKMIGLPGVFIGTLVSGILCPSMIGPYYLYTDIFCVKFRNYLAKYLEYSVIGSAAIILSYSVVSSMSFADNIIGFALRCLASLGFVSLICIFCGLILPERRYTLKYLRIVRDILIRKG